MPSHSIQKNQNRHSSVVITPTDGSHKAYLTSQLYKSTDVSIVVILKDAAKAISFLNEIKFFLPENHEQLVFFPGYNILPFKFLSYHSETTANRIRTLYQIAAGEIPKIVIATADVLLQKLIPRQELCNYAELIMPGEDIHRDILIKKLVSPSKVL